MASYPWWNSDQAPDTKPGNYYVTARDGDRHAILAGPFPNDHEAALRAVKQCVELAYACDRKAPWYGYGTARFPKDFTEPGLFNARPGLTTREAA